MEQIRPTWDEYFMLLAKLAALRSTCIARPVGAVIVKDRHVLATGYNGSPPGAPHCIDVGYCMKSRLRGDGSGAYDTCRASHAEANAIAHASRHGVSVAGATIYTTLSPCYTCAKLLASAGIQSVFYETRHTSDDEALDRIWMDAIQEAGMRAQQLSVPEPMLKRAAELLSGPTSLRRELDEAGCLVR